MLDESGFTYFYTKTSYVLHLFQFEAMSVKQSLFYIYSYL